VGLGILLELGKGVRARTRKSQPEPQA
jgi:hypothetical protein